MNMRLMQLLKLHRLMDIETGGEGGGASGGATGETDPNPAAESGSEPGAGGNKPTDAEAKLIKEVMDKKNKLKAADEARTQLEAKLKQFEGIDPEAARLMLAERKEAETRQLEAKGEWDRLRAQMAEEHSKDKTAVLEKLTAAEARTRSLESTIADLTVGNAFAQSPFIRDELALTPNKTLVVYGPHFEYQDGKVVGFDKPASAANRTPLVDASGEPLSFEAALKKIVDADPDREQLLKSKLRQGAGSKTAPKTSAPGDLKTENVQGKDRISAALAKGLLGSK